eukprot:m.127572 g.127572  ORF g.127572 m.127572 type:complete len:140 (-) comp13853_c0_seq3:155-574(-)
MTKTLNLVQQNHSIGDMAIKVHMRLTSIVVRMNSVLVHTCVCVMMSIDEVNGFLLRLRRCKASHHEQPHPQQAHVQHLGHVAPNPVNEEYVNNVRRMSCVCLRVPYPTMNQNKDYSPSQLAVGGVSVMHAFRSCGINHS